jgi:X-Pro dipeptidyl-peptidase C-terminal non-catalytic domain
MRRTTAGAGIVIEKNVSVTMSDGVTLRLNVFRPRDVVAPVVMSVTPYGKDNTPDRIGMLAMRLVSYSATPRRPRADRVSFTHRFAEDTEITGSMALTVWMSTDQGTELDVFVVVRKRDTAGQLVGFYGYNGYPNDGVAKGWLRASHRELDPSRGRPERPFPRTAFWPPGRWISISTASKECASYAPVRARKPKRSPPTSPTGRPGGEPTLRGHGGSTKECSWPRHATLRPVRKHRKHPRPGGMLKTVDRRVARLADHLLIRRVVRPACPSRTSAPTPALDQTYLDFQIVLGQVRPLHVTRPRAIHKF